MEDGTVSEFHSKNFSTVLVTSLWSLNHSFILPKIELLIKSWVLTKAKPWWSIDSVNYNPWLTFYNSITFVIDFFVWLIKDLHLFYGSKSFNHTSICTNFNKLNCCYTQYGNVQSTWSTEKTHNDSHFWWDVSIWNYDYLL